MTKDEGRATLLWDKSNDIDGDIAAHNFLIEAIDFAKNNTLGGGHKHTSNITNRYVNYDDPVAI